MSERRYLITIGSPECPGLGLSVLRRVPGDVERIAGFFTKPDQGYEQVLATECPLGATARQVEDGVCAWFAREDRHESDCVVVYIAGHGDSGVKFRDHCLLTRDSDPRLPNSIIRTAELVQWFYGGEGARPQNLLVILDVCYAGQGAGEAGAALIKDQAKILRGGAGFWVIATADANSEAGDGAFVDAFLDIMKDPAWVPPRGGARVLSPTDLSVAVNAWFGERRSAQRALSYSVGGGRVAPPFIRIPGSTRDLDGMSVADQAHWDPKARGVDAPWLPGWFFTGRRAALRELCAWLQAGRSDLRARIVTGGPGSGKSAVLGWLVLASREATRQTMEKAGLLADPALVPPPGALAARVHARGMRLKEMADTLAALLSCDARDPSALIAELASRPGPIGIIVDSLDEAAEPVVIERELLAGLAACPAVRLIVGSRRRNRRPPLESVAVVVDLDDAGYFAPSDLVTYVFSRLTSPAAAYSDETRRVHARRIADVVAERAGYSFLFARLVSRTLAAANVTVDTARPGWEADLKLPVDLTDAFGADLDRFVPETRQRFVDLLVPLAYARGKGLPQKNVWATVASRIAGREYTNADLRELKEQAGYYLLQDTESGEVVFRLFHQTFADYLKDLTQDEDVERSFAEALLSLLPSLSGGEEPWAQVGEPYLLNHFPSHAGAGGLLEDQLKRPGFLLHVSPEALLPELHRAVSPKARAIVRAYRRASHWIRGGDEEASLTYLLWGAYQHSARELAEKLQALRPRLPWYPEWAVWQPVVSGHVLGQADTTITALATAKTDQEDALVICGYEGGVIRVWNLATTEKLLELRPAQLPEKGRWPFEGPPSVSHLAVATSGGRNLIVGAWKNGSLGVFDLEDGNELSWWDRNDYKTIRALCVVPRQDECLLVVALEDYSLHTWQLPILERIASRENAAAADFHDLAPILFEGEAAVVSGSDSVESGQDTEEWPVRIWRAGDLELLWRADQQAVTNAMEAWVCAIGGTDWIVTRDFVGEVTLVNPRTHEVLVVVSGWNNRLSQIIGFHRQGPDVILVGNRYSRLRALRLRPCEDVQGESISVEDLSVRVELRGKIWSDVIGLNGRPTLVSADDRQLRVWDLQELLATETTVQGDHGPSFGVEETSLVAVAANDAMIVTGNTDIGGSDLRLWDAGGRLLWGRRFGQETVKDLAVADVDGISMILCGTGRGLLHFVSTLDGSNLREPIEVGEDITAISVHRVKGGPTAFVAMRSKAQGPKRFYAVRAWNLPTGEEIDTMNPGPDFLRKDDEKHWGLEAMGYYRNKILSCVDALEWEGSTFVVFGGPNGEMRAMGLESLQEVDRWQVGREGDYVHSLAVEVCDGRPVAFAGDEKGILVARDLASAQDGSPRLESAHRGDITALLVRHTEAGFCVVSGGEDGAVNFWRADLTHMARIETERPVTGLAFVGPDRLAVATDRGLTLLRLDWELLLRGLGS